MLVFLIKLTNGQGALFNINPTTPNVPIQENATQIIPPIINTTHSHVNHTLMHNNNNSSMVVDKPIVNSSLVHHQSNQPFLNTDVKQDIANSYSQFKFLVNSSQEVPIKTHAPSSLSLMVILISLVAVAFIIAGILTALFVMKRRFSILRINGSKGNDCSNDGANGMLTTGSGSSSETGSTHEKCIEINEKEKEALATAVNVVETKAIENEALEKNELVSVENTQAVLPVADTCQEAILVDLANKEVVQEKEEEEVKVVSQSVEIVAVPSVVDVDGELKNTVVESTVEAALVPSATVTSSSSLIANVLNELSESVVSKLQGTINEDPEKQPLNNADQ